MPGPLFPILSVVSVVCWSLIYELGVEEIMVIAHSDCRAHHMDSEEILERMKAWGIREDLIDMIHFLWC